ncbi:DUF4268 domain-containing protein [Flavobacterium selenitireducens]|uniref:DUF4268 domain-containing protein n=1 Tax=Flavobacterium selenitireducens TaxID=2722704 RepID=UPI00168AFAB4|nr:DUF4268 domain-containing protein [Flavobacterium selenitireducens]MBD3584088.1 DUF4268 domain-containing protein [Flavobacterium selenitireducens]
MYSKEEAQRIKHEFWIAFAEKYPRKWVLYDTKIKDFSLKFHVDNKKAEVMFSMENRDTEKRYAYFDKLLSLQAILLDEYEPEAIFEKDVYLENKTLSKVWVEKSGISVNNRATWDEIFDFFNDKMDVFERFFFEFEDFIKDI